MAKRLTVTESVQSNRKVYHAVVTWEELTQLLTNSVNDGTDLKHQYQRPLSTKKKDDFVSYLEERRKSQNKYVVPNLIGAFISGVDKVTFNEGNLEFDDNFQFACIDGQHRLEGIKDYISYTPQINSESVGITIFKCDSYEDRQQIFSDINGNSKPVSKALVADFDHTSNDAVFTNVVIGKIPLFLDFQQVGKIQNTVGKDKIVSTYKMQQLVIPSVTALLENQTNQPNQQQYIISAFWNALSETIPYWEQVLNHDVSTSPARAERVKLLRDFKAKSWCFSEVALLGFNQLFIQLIPYAVNAKTEWWVSRKPQESEENLKKWFLERLKPLAGLDYDLYIESPMPEGFIVLTANGKATLSAKRKGVKLLSGVLEDLIFNVTPLTAVA